ncbi:MAG: spore coat associated protein CotJA [Oscillospiraceae bacterium]
MEEKIENCDCNNINEISEYKGVSSLPKVTTVTMAYVPFQTDTTMYDDETALKNGTAFPSLDKPFLGGKCE